MSVDEYISPMEAAQVLGLRYGQIMRRIRSKKLTAKKVGWGWLVLKSSVEQNKKAKDHEASRIPA